MHLVVNPTKVIGWKLLLPIAVVIALVVLIGSLLLLLQESDRSVATLYAGTGTSSAERVAVDFSEGHLDVQLSPDAIPPLNYPPFVPWSQARLNDQTYVIGVSINGESKAYPIEVLNFREMVNDTVGGVPVLVTW